MALGTLVHGACGYDLKLSAVLRPLRRVLSPAAAALSTMGGDDCGHLARGMLNHRILYPQLRKLEELHGVPRIDSKCGHVGVAVGLSASVLAFFAAFLANETDVNGRQVEMAIWLSRILGALRSWRISDDAPPDAWAALASERRALERGEVAVERARRLNLATGAPLRRGLERCLTFYRRAVWPAGHVVDDATQHALLDMVESGELVDFEAECMLEATGAAALVGAPGVATLSALPPEGGGGDAGGHSSSGSTETASSSLSYSTLGSSSDGGGGGDGGADADADAGAGAGAGADADMQSRL